MNARSAYTLAVGVAAGLCVLQLFLPWMSLDVEVPILGSIASLTRHGYQGDGLITMFIGLLALGFAAYLRSDDSAKAFRLVTIFNGCLGVLIVATALVNLIDAERSLGDVQQQIGIDLNAFVGVDLGNVTNPEAGIYVAIAAGVILMVSSSGAWIAQRSQTTEAAD